MEGLVDGKFKLLKTTILGGLVFLVPFVVTIVLLAKAIDVARKVTEPVAHQLPMNGVLAFFLVDIAGLALLLLLCFAAGVFAQKFRAGRVAGWLEDRLLSQFPPYTFVKGMSQSIAGLEAEGGLSPVLVPTGDGWRFGFETERLADGHVAVYLPGAPNPWSGFVVVIAADRLKPVEAPLSAVVKSLRQVGRGSSELFQASPG
jgi:uncharacterized membrane protein